MLLLPIELLFWSILPPSPSGHPLGRPTISWNRRMCVCECACAWGFFLQGKKLTLSQLFLFGAQIFLSTFSIDFYFISARHFDAASLVCAIFSGCLCLSLPKMFERGREHESVGEVEIHGAVVCSLNY